MFELGLKSVDSKLDIFELCSAIFLVCCWEKDGLAVGGDGLLFLRRVSSWCVVLLSPSLTSDTRAFIFAVAALRFHILEWLPSGQSIHWRVDKDIMNVQSGSHNRQVVVLGATQWHGAAKLAKGMRKCIQLRR